MSPKLLEILKGVGAVALFTATAFHLGCECCHDAGCKDGKTCQAFKCVDSLSNAPVQNTAPPPTTTPAKPTNPN